MTTPTTAELLKYADLQMAAEAFLRVNKTGDLIPNGAALVEALVKGNDHASRFTETQAIEFQKKGPGSIYDGFSLIRPSPASGAY